MNNIITKIKEKIKSFDYILRNNEKVKKIVLGVFCVITLIFAYSLLNYRKLVEVYKLEKSVSEEVENMKISVGGETVGIKLLATGVLIMGIDREDTSLKIGDIILSVNEEKIETNIELENMVKKSNGEALKLKIDRQGEKLEYSLKPLIDEVSLEYKLGLWVKDSSAGVGTITFYDLESKKFAALGHSVTETKENYILPINAGGITKTRIYSIKKGISKVPGELKGSITNTLLGQIEGNSERGIYGKITDESFLDKKEEIEILPKSKIKEEKGSIYCTLDDNQKKEYEITIEKVFLTSNGNKNMIIKITDKELLEKTGGIVQGMSGSPIIQDGKLVGAVTHVFLNDPTRGYGVFIENMIEDMCNM